MKKYMFYQVGVIMLYTSFQQSHLIFFLPSILTFNPLMTQTGFTKNSNLLSNSLVKGICYCNHKLCYMGVSELNA